MQKRAFVRAAILGIAVVPFVAFAQSGGTAADGTAPADPSVAQGTAGGTAATSSAQPAQSAQAAQAPTQTPAQASGGAPAAAATTSSTNPRPAPVGTPTQQNSAPAPAQESATPTPVAVDNGIVAIDDGPNLLVRAVEFLLLIIPFGFIVGYFRMKKAKKQDDESDEKNRCFDIEQLMKDKLRELTDLKAMMQEKTVEMGKELLRDSVTGTKTGDLLVKIEKLEEQYNKLKALYEECKIDVDHYRYKGIVIENSLLNKKILEEVRVLSTRTVADWIVHDIRLGDGQIEKIQRNISDKTWYFHFWKPGNDEVTVVFKDATYKIKHSDKSTWKKAIAHGVECGIPEAQLDFPVV